MSANKKTSGKKPMVRKDDPATWSKCMFFLERKKRFCNMQRVAGQDMCGVHVNGGLAGAATGRKDLRRVPCPADPSHSVYATDLKAHVRVCNRSKDAAALEAMPYFKRDINSGDDSLSRMGGAQPKAAAPLGPSTFPAFGCLVGQVESLYAACLEGRIVDHTGLRAPAACQAYLEQTYQTHTADSAGQGATGKSRRAAHRHLAQQAAILGALEARGLLPQDTAPPKPGAPHADAPGSSEGSSEGYCYLELGAGRGMLGLALRSAVPAAPIVLIERAAVRNKADRELRKRAAVAKKGPAAPSPGVAPAAEAKSAAVSSDRCQPESKRARLEEQGAGVDKDEPAGPETVAAGFFRARVDLRHLDLQGLPYLARDDADSGAASFENPGAAQARGGAGGGSGGGSGGGARALGPEGGPRRASAEHEAVAVAKHLCGVATDLGLRCLRTLGSNDAASQSPGDAAEEARGKRQRPHQRSYEQRRSKGQSSRVAGVCIATCCHHACEWGDYVGRPWWLAPRASGGLGLRREHFEAMAKVSGWACTAQPRQAEGAGDGPAETAAPEAEAGAVLNEGAGDHEGTPATRDREPPVGGPPPQAVDGESDSTSAGAVSEAGCSTAAGLVAVAQLTLRGDPARKAKFGRMCKRLLDWGRLEFLRRELGLETELAHYCSPETSPENALLIAWRK